MNLPVSMRAESTDGASFDSLFRRRVILAHELPPVTKRTRLVGFGERSFELAKRTQRNVGDSTFR